MGKWTNDQIEVADDWPGFWAQREVGFLAATAAAESESDEDEG